MAKKRSPAQSVSPQPQNTFTARVTAGHGRHHFVTCPDGLLYEAHRRGKKNDVVVGDMVVCSQPTAGLVAIESILPRRSLLFRSDEWRIKELAANVDQVAIVFASRPTYNPWFVWKAIIAAQTASIPVLAIRNKEDLAENAEQTDAFVRELGALQCPCIAVSAQSRPEQALQCLGPVLRGKTTLLIGQSGMGKSTLLNVFCPDANARTQEFSEALNLGKQTTTATRLWTAQIDGTESYLIDSPGFQEFGLAHVDINDILRAMPDIAQHITGCRFYNCTHTNEPGCAVLEAVQRGDVSAQRFAFYKELVRTVLAKPSY